MSETPPTDVAAEILRPMLFADEQRLLGVGVRVQRRPRLHLRHAPALAAHTAALLEGARGPAHAIVAARLATLRARLARLPFWHERLRATGCAPGDLQDLRDLSDFPTLDRDAHARDFARMFDLDGDPELHLATSSGSTGQALLVVRSGYDGLHTYAVLDFFLAHLDIPLPTRPRLVLLCALPGGLEYSVRAPQFANGALHRISTIRPRALARLHKSQPAVLSTDPAGLHWITAQTEPLPRPRLVISSAQHLSPSLRAAATGALGAPILNYYALTETGPIAWECLREPGRFHVLHPDVWVESIQGELAVTRLRDSPLPLLRYLTGDRGEIEDGACSCGVTGRSIFGFAGRRACAFRTPDGTDIDAWSISWLFKDLPLVRFQLTQVAPQDFELWLEGDPASGGFAPRWGDPTEPPLPRELLLIRLGRALVRLGFPAPQLAWATEAPRSPTKPEPFVSRYHSQP